MPTADAERLKVAAVALLPHLDRPDAVDIAVSLADALFGRDRRVLVTPAGAAAMDRASSQSPFEVAEASVIAREADLAVAIGGDGTLLQAFRLLGSVPLVGVHCGELGYLALVERDAIGAFVDAAVGGELTVERRLALQVDAVHEGGRTIARALNDVVIGKGVAGHVPRIGLTVDDAPFATVVADALVIATPTGSTAYNFSARGPLVSPDVDAFALTPVAPHTLWDRSLVLGPDSRVQLRVVDDRRATVQADGAGVCELGKGESVVVTAADEPARLVRWGGQSFTGRVSRTFGLDRSRR